MNLPVVAIVGRPNVGKSTLFNFIVKRNLAITSPVAGTTRDRLYERVSIDDHDFMLVDTGGIETVNKKDGVIEVSIQDQVKIALAEADLLVFLVDTREGLVGDDVYVAKEIRKSGKPFIFVASKTDRDSDDTLNFLQLGMGEAHAVSTKQGRGVPQLLKRIISELDIEKDDDKEREDITAISFIGRPNAGKSSLVNKLLGEERQIVSEVAGTTRDASSIYFTHNDHLVRFVDTAGMRRQKKVDESVEHYSNLRSIHTISHSDVCVLVIDAVEGVTAQDLRLASLIHECSTGAIICVNKWDLVEKDDTSMNRYIKYLYRKLDFLEFAPCVFTSALNGQRVSNILDMAIDIEQRSRTHLPTQKLNAVVEDVARKHPPARRNKKLNRPKIYYVTQVGVNPLEFVLFVNSAENFHPSYFKFLERRMREVFELDGVGMKFLMRSKGSDDSEKAGGKKFSRRVLGSAHRQLEKGAGTD